jgi:hypothetical protein
MFDQLSAGFVDGRNSLLDLRYNLHILQKPAFEVPNPLILSSVLRFVSNNFVAAGNEGAPHCDKTNAHSFIETYKRYIMADETLYRSQVTTMWSIIEEFFRMYEHNAQNLWLVNQMLSASTYIQNNQTELPAMAYHGNLTIDKTNGRREDVRCVGHLGNSYPGSSCVREGKGMVNTYVNMSMPTSVHVM